MSLIVAQNRDRFLRRFFSTPNSETMQNNILVLVGCATPWMFCQSLCDTDDTTMKKTAAGAKQSFYSSNTCNGVRCLAPSILAPSDDIASAPRIDHSAATAFYDVLIDCNSISQSALHALCERSKCDDDSLMLFETYAHLAAVNNKEHEGL